jgi:hypothetical protein
VVERTDLRAERRRPEAILRRGITQVPEHGARVVQTGPPRPAPAGSAREQSEDQRADHAAIPSRRRATRR